MNILKKINKFSGIAALLACIIMLFDIVNIIRCSPNNLLYYISSTTAIVFGAVFLITAVIFAVRSIVWHLRHKHVARLIRHYLYTVTAIFIACILVEHVFNGQVMWISCVYSSLCLALVQVYASGYKLCSAQ